MVCITGWPSLSWERTAPEKRTGSGMENHRPMSNREYADALVDV